MRTSRQTRNERVEHQAPAAEFFSKVAEAVAPAERVPCILLVGGNDFRSNAIRRAQAPLRFDLRPSYWSHAALICEWPEDDPKSAKGLEVAIEPQHGERHAPEENGVTPFSLARYCNDEAYPNLALAIIRGPATQPEPSPTALDWRETVAMAARSANDARPQFVFYQWLADWIRFAMLPYTTANPLLENRPHPGAAFLDYAFAAAGIDLAPGATHPNTAPEHLWSTFLRWHDHIGEQFGRLEISTRIRQRDCLG